VVSGESCIRVLQRVGICMVAMGQCIDRVNVLHLVENFV